MGSEHADRTGFVAECHMNVGTGAGTQWIRSISRERSVQIRKPALEMRRPGWSPVFTNHLVCGDGLLPEDRGCVGVEFVSRRRSL
jgi:hypothetical protein